MIAVVAVGVATRRPPRAHRTIRYVVAVDALDDLDPGRTETAAQLLACQWACARSDTPRIPLTDETVVMPVSSTIVELLEV